MPGVGDFLGGVKTKSRPVSGEGGVNESSPGARSADVLSTSPPAETDDTPRGVTEVTLPSGIEVYYQAAPKRLYRVRQLLQPDVEAFDWVEVPSISTVTDILDKPGLVHWGEKVGINLVQELLRNEWADPEFVTRVVQNEDKHPEWFGGAHLQEIGKTKKLTNYYMRDEAATRGDDVHKALELWSMTGDLADPEQYPVEQQGYVVGLNKWITESRFQPLRSEVIVASVEHRVAGRFDVFGELPEQVDLFTHITKKGRGDRRETFEPGSRVVDLKTSSGVYPNYHLQVAGYKGILEESGYEPAEYGEILRVTADGRYELKPVRAEWLDFWFLRGLYDAIQRIEGKS